LQAQIAAALTPAFASDSSPLLKDTACRTCAAYISSGLYKESIAVGRLWRILIAMLEPEGLSCCIMQLFCGYLCNQCIDTASLSHVERVILKLSTSCAWAELYLAGHSHQKFLLPLIQPYPFELIMP
jgi:hypothetical protein